MREFDRWYRQAVRNLEAARSDLASGFYEWACFKAQQAAELAVKALLRARGVPRGGHSVLKLLEIAEAELGLQVPQELKEAAAELDNMYIPPRYPDAFAEGSPYEFFTKAMAERAMANAERILRWAAEAWSAGR
ncbi:HEPN domain-containing protein [Pyrobaculum sp.]|uniref:HEPN domain-containing protein n=1 Tax=Pyrobaculum sp. TaxID=2004705 RepID=UPI00315F15A7